MCGMHSNCDEFYCNEEIIKKYKLDKIIKLPNEAIVDLENYLQKLICRRDKLRKGVTSNLAEAFFSVCGKCLSGKIKNLA